MKKFLFVLAIMFPASLYAQFTGAPGNIYYNTGNVGIGTTSPISQLHLASDNDHAFTLTRANGTFGFRILRDALHGNIYFQIGNNLGSWENKIKIGEGEGSGTKLFLNPDGGNVGIGSISATQRLDVRGGALQVVNYSNNGYTFLGRNTDPGNDSYFYHFISANYHILGSNKNGTGIQRKLGFALGGGDTENDIKMMIDNSGNVGIGTRTPDTKLAVLGTIHSNEVRVDLSVPGPDYVFENSYNLPTLEELSAYIKVNKHLPEVPSACAMEENGVKLGEMNMLLLKKVEELTLYLLEQQKTIAEQGKKINQMELQLNNLQK